MNTSAIQTFKVAGMTCGHCARSVTAAIKSADPTATVEIDLAAGRVTIGNAAIPPDRIAAAIAAEGYAAEAV